MRHSAVFLVRRSGTQRVRIPTGLRINSLTWRSGTRGRHRVGGGGGGHEKEGGDGTGGSAAARGRKGRDQDRRARPGRGCSTLPFADARRLWPKERGAPAAAEVRVMVREREHDGQTDRQWARSRPPPPLPPPPRTPSHTPSPPAPPPLPRTSGLGGGGEQLRATCDGQADKLRHERPRPLAFPESDGEPTAPACDRDAMERRRCLRGPRAIAGASARPPTDRQRKHMRPPMD